MGYFTAEKLHSFKKIFFTAFRVEIYFLSLNRYVYGMIAIKFEIKSVFPFKKSFNSNMAYVKPLLNFPPKNKLVSYKE